MLGYRIEMKKRSIIERKKMKKKRYATDFFISWIEFL